MNTSSLWTLILLLAIVSCSPGKGEVRMICSSQPIVAEPGDDVILPCQLDPAINAQNFIVEWFKPDLKPDPSKGLSWDHYVHLYHGEREILELKIPSYINRTQLFTEELNHGNISLKILNVTSGDAGRYMCFIPNLKKPAVVQLVVAFKTRTTETPPYSGYLQTPDQRDKTDDKEVDQTRWIVPVISFFLLFVLTVVVIGFLNKRQRQKQAQKHDVECDVVLNTQSVVVDGDQSLVHFTVLDLSN